MIIIVDYGMGNLHSVLKAFKRIGAEVTASKKVSDIEVADKLVLPGVGYFKQGMKNLKKLGLIEVLNKKVVKDKIPILGICLGMQLITNHSEEGNVNGLGWINAKTIKLKLDNKFKVPHMGWNDIIIKKKSNLLEGIKVKEQFYFVHSDRKSVV